MTSTKKKNQKELNNTGDENIAVSESVNIRAEVEEKAEITFYDYSFQPYCTYEMDAVIVQYSQKTQDGELIEITTIDGDKITKSFAEGEITIPVQAIDSFKRALDHIKLSYIE